MGSTVEARLDLPPITEEGLVLQVSANDDDRLEDESDNKLVSVRTAQKHLASGNCLPDMLDCLPSGIACDGSNLLRSRGSISQTSWVAPKALSPASL